MELEIRLELAATSLINGQRKQACEQLYKGCKSNPKEAIERSLRFIEHLENSNFTFEDAINETSHIAQHLK